MTFTRHSLTTLFASLAVAALLLLSLPSPTLARGGGGGGGHGGLGGGHGFGGGGFGGYGNTGGFGGYGGYGGYRSFGYPYSGYHSGYYGGGYYGGGGDAIFVWILLIVVGLFVIGRLGSAMSGRRTLAVITLVLTNGARYTESFQRITQSANFDRPEMRNFNAHSLFDRVDEHDIIAAFVHTLDSGVDPDQLGAQAKQIWQTEMDKADVKPDIINVSSPGNKLKAQFAPDTAAGGDDLATDGCCLVSVIVVASGIGTGSSTDRGGAVATLHRLHSAMIDSFYFFFTPSSGQAMPRYEAIQVLEQLHGFAA